MLISHIVINLKRIQGPAVYEIQTEYKNHRIPKDEAKAKVGRQGIFKNDITTTPFNSENFPNE